MTSVYSAMFDELRKMAAERKLEVYSYVAKSSLPQVMEHGLHSGKSLIKNPALLESAAQARGITADKMRADIEANLSTWKGYSSLGPNVMFATIDPEAKLHEKHPAKIRELVAVKVDLSALLKDQPKTRLYGMELRPYDEYKKDRAAGPRHRYLKHKEVVELTSKTPKEIWSTYNDIEGRGLYAPDVPHAAVHTPSGHIDPKYIKLAADRVFYHGSPTGGLERLDPRKDPRTGETGLFVSEEPHTPSLFSLLKNRSRSNVNTKTEGGKFMGGTVRPSSEGFGETGHLYEIRNPPKGSVVEYKPGRYILTESVTPHSVREVSKADILKHWAIEKKEMGR